MHPAEPFERAEVPSARGFLIRAAVFNLALFGIIRLAWVDRHLIGMLVEFQKSVVFWYGTTPHASIYVNSSCSGADVMALCAGVLLAYPIGWARRIAGAAVGIGLILALNAVRIASLYAVASTPQTLNLLHLYVWPAVLTIATVLFVFAWIRASERRTVEVSRRWRRFALSATGSLVVFALVAPWALTSSVLLQAGVWTAAISSALLGAMGVQAQSTGNVLVTARGAFQVTQECLFTPMLPVYLAGVFSVPMTRRARGTWLAAALPLFFLLGLARVLVLALPGAVVEAPLVLVHGFYQLVAGAVAIVAASHLALRHVSGLRASARTVAALAVALVAAAAAGPAWSSVVAGAAASVATVAPWTLTSFTPAWDRQGAVLLLPAFQVGLLAGLWLALTGGRRWRGLAWGGAVLAGLQVGFLVALGALARWTGLEPHALVIRAFAVGAPIVIAAATWGASGGATRAGDRGYRRFWQEVGEHFPSLTGAASTAYYLESEQRLIADALPSLAGCAVLKTDLWDEAKNTRILRWVADRGARVYGIDISEPIVRQARDVCGRATLRPVVTDVRRLPFGDGSFDAIYSMGTIEHFAETEATVAELARLLRPGGRLILGVPNRHDPFLRPLFVAVLSRFGLYGYGYEKSYSRRALRRMIEDAGLDVRMESGLLFIPGWLRMLDLWCHAYARPLAAVTGALVAPFVWIDRRVPSVRRHGYLLASVGVKPMPAAPPPPRTNADAPSEGPRRPVWQSPGGALTATAAVDTGREYVVDARGCSADALQSLPRLQQLFDAVCADLGLHALAPAVWHVFPGHGGVTGIVLLSESHLTIHTYPEIGAAAINPYCCRAGMVEWPWQSELRSRLGASAVDVRHLRRGGGGPG